MKERLNYDKLIIGQSFFMEVIMKKGIIITLLGGTFWGISGTMGQFLFQTYHLNTMWLTTLRMIFAGMIFLSGSVGVFYKPVEVSNKVVILAILIIVFIICYFYRKNKKRR